MEKRFKILAVLIVLLAAFTQCEKLKPKPTKGNISGTVTDANTGKPIAGVLVSVKETSIYSKTLADGRYELTDVDEGSCTVITLKQGYKDVDKDVFVEGGETKNLDISLKVNSEPVGGILECKVIEYSSKYAKFKIDFFIADDNEIITSISDNDINIKDSQFSDGTYFDFTKKNLHTTSLDYNGSYSANLVLDQSGSISSTDPDNLRLEAVKIFCSNLSSSDYVLLTAFASGGLLDYDVTRYGDFTNNGESYFGTIESLRDKIDGGTPLYKATASAIDRVYNDGPTSNKAVVVFTDGEDTDGGWTMNDVIDEARSKNVKIYTVGLSSGTKNEILSRMAIKTGGAFIKAYNAPQLVSAFGTLGKILKGTAQIYSGVWSVNTSEESFPGWFQTSIKVNYKGEELSIPFHLDANAYSKSAKLKHFTNEVITKSVD